MIICSVIIASSLFVGYTNAQVPTELPTESPTRRPTQPTMIPTRPTHVPTFSRNADVGICEAVYWILNQRSPSGNAQSC